MTDGYLVCDMQFGSTGKGLLAGYLARRIQPDVVVAAWGPNAGHTYVDGDRKIVTTMIPIGAIVPKAMVLIGPGATINPESLLKEAQELNALDRLRIHQNAAVVNTGHRSAEAKLNKIGSTQKGTMEAAIQKMQRDEDNNNLAINDPQLSKYCCGTEEYIDWILDAKSIGVEGAQGFSLSIHHGLYPYVTSRDTTPMQIMADCGVPLSKDLHIYGTMRTYPIRVSNRYDSEGNMVGFSGPHYGDQQEVSWEDIGVSPEFTTVTKLKRRVFTFSKAQIRLAMKYIQPHSVFLNFMNYLPAHEQESFVRSLTKLGIPISLLGYGPDDSDIRMWLEYFN